jgi:hypothetical protein
MNAMSDTVATEVQADLLRPADANRNGLMRSEPPLEESTVLLQVIARAAQDTTIDIDRMERLIEIQQKLAAKKSERDFTEALARFQANAPVITKDKRVFFKSKNGGADTDYRHATLGNVSAAILAVLGQERISVSWIPEQRDARIFVTCVLKHVGGHETRTTLNGAPDTTGNKNPVQQVVSTITMLERYTLLAATGMATHDQDDDGRGGHGEGETGGGDQGGQQNAPRTYDPAKFDLNFPKWSQLISAGRKSHADIIATVEAAAPLTDDQKKRINGIKVEAAQ